MIVILRYTFPLHFVIYTFRNHHVAILYFSFKLPKYLHFNVYNEMKHKLLICERVLCWVAISIIVLDILYQVFEGSF